MPETTRLRRTPDLVTVEVVMPRECIVSATLRATIVPQPHPDIVVLRHRVFDKPVVAAAGRGYQPVPGGDSYRMRVTVPTLPHQPGLYYGRMPIGVGYEGCALRSLADRVPVSLAHNLPGETEWVLTATTVSGLPLTDAQVRHAEALLIGRTHARWHLANEKVEPTQRLPYGADAAAERLAAALEYAIEHDLPPLANPVLDAGNFRRGLHRRLGVALGRRVGAALENAVAGRPWAGRDQKDPAGRWGRDLIGRADSGTARRVPVAERLVHGLYAPLGWSQSKFAGRRDGWLNSIARQAAAQSAARRTAAAGPVTSSQEMRPVA